MDAIRPLVCLITRVNGKSKKDSVCSYNYSWSFAGLFSSWVWCRFDFADIMDKNLVHDLE